MLDLSHLQYRLMSKHGYLLALVLILFCLKSPTNAFVITSNSGSPNILCACIDVGSSNDDYVATQHHTLVVSEGDIVNFPEPSRLILSLDRIAQRPRGPPKYLW